MARDNARPLTDKQFAALRDCWAASGVTGHWRTLDSLARRGLIKATYGWYEQPAGRYHKRARATERTWGVTGFAITAQGRKEYGSEAVRRGA